jgi:putative ABC transport system permease protein
MFRNHLSVAVRSLLKNRATTALNVLGLAIAASAFLLIMHYVQFEYSYENFNPKADQVYRVTQELYNGNEFVTTDCETEPPLGPAVKAQMTEVVDFVRVQHFDGSEAREISVGNNHFPPGRLYAADPSIFPVLGHKLLKGNPNQTLHRPWQVVLTESAARKFFGSTDVVGKTLRLNRRPETITVSGVMQDVPENTHLKFDVLLSFASLKEIGWNLDSWTGNNNYTYFQLLPGASLPEFNRKLQKLYREKRQKGDKKVVAESIRDIHLYSHKEFEPEVNGDSQTVQFLLVVALLILLIGAINYVNLSTARAAERAKEVGIRKTLGSSQASLIGQFLTESLLVNGLAFAGALLLIYLVAPFYQTLIGKPVPVNFFQSPGFWKMGVALFAGSNLLSGLYPALVLAGASPALVTTRHFTGSAKGGFLRKGLVVSQFAASFVLLVGTAVVYQQVRFMRSQDLGLKPEQMLVVKGPVFERDDSVGRSRTEVFRKELLRSAGVTAVSQSGAVPGVSMHELSTTSGITRLGANQKSGFNFYYYGIDAHFIPALQIGLAAGRNFHADSPNKDQVIINEEAARVLGFQSPEAAIGQRISFNQATVVGVVKNYHQRSLKDPHMPMIHYYWANGGNFYSVKLRTADLHAAITGVEQTWKGLFPGQPLHYQFLDQLFDQQYRADLQFERLAALFSVLTVLVACLGLLGLASYNTLLRTKEIGVRKILGATVSQLVVLLSADFLKLVGLAVVLGIPLAWYVTRKWLENYAYRVELGWEVFALAGGLALLIALLTVSYQSIKSALANPVDSLRSE